MFRVVWNTFLDSIFPSPTAMSAIRRADTLRTRIERHQFLKLTDVQALELFKTTFADEIACLKRASPSVESSPATKDNLKGNPDASPSQFLYGEDLVEVNRTLMGMLALKWILTGSYEAFTNGQPRAVKLTKNSFEELQTLFSATLQDSNGDDVYCLLVATLVNDLGKDPEYYEKVKDYVEPHANHDTVIYVAAKHDMVELVKEFYGTEKEDLMLGLQFGSGLNGAQLQQAENVPGSLEGALIMRGHERAFEKKFLELLLDVSGADGHLHAKGAKTMIEPVFQGYKTTRNVLKEIVSGKYSLREGYDQVLIQRGEMLVKGGFKRLNVRNNVERALLRFLCMCRASTKEQGEKVYDAFWSLSPDIRKALVDGLSVDGYKDGVAILPYYAPGMFAEASKATAEEPRPTQVAALASIMRFLSRVYCGTKPEPGQPGSIIEFDLSFAQGIIKEERFNFRKNPAVLDTIELPEKPILDLIEKAKQSWTLRPTQSTGLSCTQQCGIS